MADKSSRAYKLKLSDAGIALFLRCHDRLCHLVGDFLPYGTTLYVCVTLLDRMPADELAGEIQDEALAGYGGREIRFVGTSGQLAVVTANLTDRISKVGYVHPAPQTWKLYLAALCFMREADDAHILQAYDELCTTEGSIKPRRQSMPA